MNATTLQPSLAGRMGEAPPRVSSGHIYGRADLTWHTLPDGTHALHCYGRADALLHVVPDVKYAGMWRIAHPDGHLSDMVNLSRARDAAASVALGILNAGRRKEAA